MQTEPANFQHTGMSALLSEVSSSTRISGPASDGWTCVLQVSQLHIRVYRGLLLSTGFLYVN